jgi:hypothetical protein
MFDHAVDDKSLYIQKRFPITEDEFNKLEEKYGKLCWFAANKLAASQHRSPEDLDDFHSEIQIGMCRAGSYFKRQTFIENAFQFLRSQELSKSDKKEFDDIENLWNTKKSRFGIKEEDNLRSILDNYNEKDFDYSIPLDFDEKFKVYCKAIIWNTYKALGQQMSKENSVRSSEISLDEWPFLDGDPVTKDPEYIANMINQHDFQNVRKELIKLDDDRIIKTFDIITHHDNHDEIFKQKKHGEIKINAVRKQTKMSYRTINKKLKTIKKVIKNQFGE